MTAPPWTQIPLEGDERTMLLAFLTFYRNEFLDRARGLDADELQRPLTDSGLTLGRLITHMAFVEDIWFRVRLDGEAPAPRFAALDFDADPDAEMTLSHGMSFDDATEVLHEAIADADARIAASSLDQRTVRTTRAGEHWSLRWILVHMIEEYARHCGHADLIREAIDGDTAD
ncbi:MAG: DinB family protein [Actinomycetota bacterium]